MFTNLFSKSKIKKTKISTVVTLLLPSESVKDGVLVRQSSFRCVDAAAPENQFKSSDFSIGNLLDAGAFNILKQSCFVNKSRLVAADSFDNFNIGDDVQKS